MGECGSDKVRKNNNFFNKKYYYFCGHKFLTFVFTPYIYVLNAENPIRESQMCVSFCLYKILNYEKNYFIFGNRIGFCCL